MVSCCSKVEKLVILTTQKILQLDEFDDDVMPIYENTFNSDPGTFVFFKIVLGFFVVIRIFYIYLKWHEIENHKGLKFDLNFSFQTPTISKRYKNCGSILVFSNSNDAGLLIN